ncbi:hypothetical protein QJS10_CPB19g01003 [Acorus calamus]|uniref:DUF4187 domain-containing protein n=1 Tax=Acorus calamus TaxID=4465 RepID=A0AAV9CDQ8_ACOCL|nr:hypothetical protein QJS10_CPB19g01003 [Acorus calamus]
MAEEERVNDDDGDDYMGDLSRFIASETPSIPSKKKPSLKTLDLDQPPKPKRLKNLPWQEKRRVERELKQREEDKKTLEKIESSAIPPSNVGFRLLQKMGYDPGTHGGDKAVGLEIRRTRAGIGTVDPARKVREEAERRRRSEEGLMEEFGERKRTQWRGRRVTWDYRKAEAVMAQLENKEVVEPDKVEEGEVKEEGEEEEVVITEEDLQDILMKLREEHRYCLYCGCQYESEEALSNSCPGLNEDDH